MLIKKATAVTDNNGEGSSAYFQRPSNCEMLYVLRLKTFEAVKINVFLFAMAWDVPIRCLYKPHEFW